MEKAVLSKGIVEFIAFPSRLQNALYAAIESDRCLEQFIQSHSLRRREKGNLIFNYPRQQYAALDRGETPSPINASWFTLSNDAYTNPATVTVSGETQRVAATTKAVDPANPKNSIIRFVLDVGQFTGSWKTAILIGGNATETPGTGNIIAAVNDVRDDANTALNRDGTTIHLVNWKLKHLDASEV